MEDHSGNLVTKINDIIPNLKMIFSCIETGKLCCTKKKNFKGEYIVYLRKSNNLIVFIQTNEIQLNILQIKDDLVNKVTKRNLKFSFKENLDLIIKKIIVSQDEKLIAFIGKKHIAISILSDIEQSKENSILKIKISDRI